MAMTRYGRDVGEDISPALTVSKEFVLRVREVMLRQDQNGHSEHDVGVCQLEEPETSVQPALRCRTCGWAVTSEDQRTAVNGRHNHVFFNPHGQVFEIGCFAQAPGAIPASPSSAEFSWFPGLVWQVAVCAACQVPLGWRFRDVQDSGFFGLILDRLRKDGG